MQYDFSPKLFNPLYWHIKAALRDEAIRYIYVEGGSSAAKTHSICQALLIDQYEHEYNSAVFRRYHVDIKDYIYASFKKVRQSLQFEEHYDRCIQDLIKSADDKGDVIFKGLDDEDRVKGLELVKVVYMNEWNQFTEKQWDQMRKRLRGMPNQKFICDWNPVSAEMWQYKEWLDKDEWIDLPLDDTAAPTKYSSLNGEHAFKRINKKGDSIWIKVTFRDNFWIVGHPSGKGGYVDEHVLADFERDRIQKPNLYRIYANGERGVIRTGGEFWNQFNEITHTADVKYKRAPVHVSCDQNTKPYVALSIWQLEGKRINQIHELPCASPHNNAVKAARKFCSWLDSIGHEDVVYIYGDPAGNARSVVDENSSSFFDKFIQEVKDHGYIVVDKVKKAHPSVALSAAFVNEIYEFEYEGYSIRIGKSCAKSIEDYTVVQADKEGLMVKTKIKDPESKDTYEPHGHLSDTKRYFITTILESEFKKFKAKKSKYVFS